MKTILSPQNNSIKHIVKLQKKSYRKKHNQFIAQGATVCFTLIKQGYKAIELYITERAQQKYQQELTNLPITTVSEAIIKKISTSSSPTGIVALFEIPKQRITLSDNAIVLYDIQDPGNMGTLIRTAAGMNISNVYIIDGADPYGPKVIQATAGTIAFVTIIVTTWQQFKLDHPTSLTVALVVDDGQKPEKVNLTNSILVIGNEGQGLTQEVINDCHTKMTLPMPGNTESLNASIAGSIAMYLKSQT